MSSTLVSVVCMMWRHLVKATEITAGMAEINGILRPGGWLKIICRLTSCTPGSAPSQRLVTSMGELYLFNLLIDQDII